MLQVGTDRSSAVESLAIWKLTGTMRWEGLVLYGLEVWVILIFLLKLPLSVVSGKRSDRSSNVTFVFEALIEPLTWCGIKWRIIELGIYLILLFYLWRWDSKSKYGLIDLRWGSVRSILEIDLEVVNFLIFSPLILIVDERLINLVFPTATFIISVSDQVNTWGWNALLGLSGAMRTGGISWHCACDWHEVVLLRVLLIRLKCHEVICLMQMARGGMMVLRYGNMLYLRRWH